MCGHVRIFTVYVNRKILRTKHGLVSFNQIYSSNNPLQDFSSFSRDGKMYSVFSLTTKRLKGEEAGLASYHRNDFFSFFSPARLLNLGLKIKNSKLV